MLKNLHISEKSSTFALKFKNDMKRLTLKDLCEAALQFCKQESGRFSDELYGVTDGKAVGTFVEHRFEDFLAERFDMLRGSSANGLDLPSVKTDIKVTSIVQPQSSCPYKSNRQKIYGLGYNLIVFVYRKEDDHTRKKGALHFVSCTFIEADRTADYQLTRGLNEILANDGNADDIFAFLSDRQVPGDDMALMRLAEEIISNPPKQGYLTISNALQWRLQYARVIELSNSVSGVVNYEW